VRAVQFKHFDHHRKRLTVFSKGGKIRDLPIPQSSLWFDLERLILEEQAEPTHYLLPRQKSIPRRGRERPILYRWHDQPMGEHGAHSWWYRCLERAGVVAEGVTAGEKMHKARYTAGQRVLNKTGNLKAAQKTPGPRVDPDDGRYLHRLGHRPARRNARGGGPR
jgi:hypothetical protein